MGAMSFIPNKDGTTTIKTCFNYFVSKNKRRYYEHYEGAEDALTAAQNFAYAHYRVREVISRNITHDKANRRVNVEVIERNK